MPPALTGPTGPIEGRPMEVPLGSLNTLTGHRLIDYNIIDDMVIICTR